jgi:excisionase family DNA binding protein
MAALDEFAPLAFGIRDACRITGLGRTTIYQAIAKGELTARKRGRRTIILSQDLAHFLDRLPALRAVSALQD